MTKYVSNINDARRKKRDKAALTSKEIKERARQRLQKYRGISKDEPANLASGDMDKMLCEEDGDDDDTEKVMG
ncbi:hypothetical protein [Dyella choica]|uniref:Uncharacterized protein n=1 Tax=Dyella choica TaxID=1927959 RepID=A0A3S0S275_9GAMM|nr:hypothetical protein [Dyella choica]RUL78390.1 hypothetical protein EKH80_06095 [Dyella choica]